ncbi:unnamed protein product [Sympodiomycopsis kandeliae]
MTRLCVLPRQGADLATSLTRLALNANGSSATRSLTTSSRVASSSSSSVPSSSRYPLNSSSPSSAVRTFSSSRPQALAAEAVPPAEPASEASESADATPKETAEWSPSSRRVGLLARKKGMVTYFLPTGENVGCTVLQVDDCQISAHIGFESAEPHPTHDANGSPVKVPKTAPYMALQVAAGNVLSRKNIPKTVKGHLLKAGIKDSKRTLKEFKITADAVLPLGTTLSASHFVPGQDVDVSATSRGKGFQGAMKRHGFSGLRASHGVSISHRAHGSTGQHQDPGRVFPGKKMAGRMGGRRSTVHSLKVLRIDLERDLIYVQGNVPGPDEGSVEITDARRSLIWKAVKKNKRTGVVGSEALPQGIQGLPFPAGTKEMAASLPKIVEWNGESE